MNKKRISVISILLIFALLLTACNLPGSTSSGSTQAANNAYSGSGTSAATEPPAAALAPGACLIGTWKLNDFAPYMDSIKQNLSEKSNNNFTFTSGDFSGSATFVFNADNTTSLKMDNFVQSFTMSMKVSDTTMDIPVTLTVNGTSSAKYSTDGDQITFSDQDPGDMQVTIDNSGNTSTMDQSMFGDPGTQKVYQYSCVDTNTLSLKVIAVESMDLAPFMLTRVP